MFERLCSAGHDPYSMTISQVLAFDKSMRKRKKEEALQLAYILRAAQHADAKDFAKVTESLGGKIENEDEDDEYDFSNDEEYDVDELEAPPATLTLEEAYG